MRKSKLGEHFFSFAGKVVCGLMVSGIVHSSLAMDPLVPYGDGSLEEERGEAKSLKSEFVSVQEEIQQAVEQSSSYDAFALYTRLKEKDLTSQRWQEEWEHFTQRTQRKNAVVWSVEGPKVYQTNLCGILFLETAVNEPHMQLVKNILLPLIEASGAAWDEEYKVCVEKLGNLMEHHHYFRRTGGLYGLIAASGFKNPIASLIFLAAFRSVWEESLSAQGGDKRSLSERNQAWFVASLEKVNGRLKSQKATLNQFLGDADPRYVDIDEKSLEDSVAEGDPKLEEKHQRTLFDEKRRLGLSCYAIRSGRCIGEHFRGDDLSESNLLESVHEVLACCEEALEGRDPRGGTLYAFGVNGFRKILPKHLRQSARNKLIDSIKLGDLGAITVWQNERSQWISRKEKLWAEDLLHTYAINYERMCQFFERVQGE